MEIKVSTYKKQSTLISSIIFFILGGILFTNPDIFITTISKIFGVILLIIGLFFVSLIFFKKEEENSNLVTKIISALFFLTLAVLFFFFSETIEKAIRIVVGFWIIFCGFVGIICLTFCCMFIYIIFAKKDERRPSIGITDLNSGLVDRESKENSRTSN